MLEVAPPMPSIGLPLGIGAADDVQQYPIAGLAVGRQVAGKEEHSLAGAPRM